MHRLENPDLERRLPPAVGEDGVPEPPAGLFDGLPQTTRNRRFGERRPKNRSASPLPPRFAARGGGGNRNRPEVESKPRHRPARHPRTLRRRPPTEPPPTATTRETKWTCKRVRCAPQMEKKTGMKGWRTLSFRQGLRAPWEEEEETKKKKPFL